MESCEPCYATCPSGWIGFGSKCFYFSEDVGNWTFSQSSCMALDSHLALFDSLEELNFLKRYKGPSNHWIGLHRASTEHPWIWTDNTKYNNMVLTRGGGECAYLSESGIRSGRGYTRRKWICNKPNSYTVQCPLVVDPGQGMCQSMREKQMLCDLLSTVASLLRIYQSHYQNPSITTLTAKMKTSLEGHRYTT